MISDSIFSGWRSEWQWGVWFIVGLAVIGTAAFLEKGGWEAAVRIPLGIATFGALTIVFADLLIWLFGKGKLRKPWYILLAISLTLLAILSVFGNPVYLVLLAFLVAGVLLIMGAIKSAFYKR